MQGKQELSRVQAALEGVLGAKAAAEQELQDAQRGAAAAASQAATAQEALEEAKASLCKVRCMELILKRLLYSVAIYCEHGHGAYAFNPP